MSELRGEMGGLRGEVRAGFAELRVEQSTTTRQLMPALISTTLTTIAAVAAIVH